MASKNTIQKTAAQKSAALHTPPAKTDAKVIASQARLFVAAFDDVQRDYRLAALSYKATASPDDGGLGLSVRALAEAVTKARFVKAYPAADAQAVKDGTVSGSAFFVGKSTISNYAASFRVLEALTIASADTYRAAQMLRNRVSEGPATVAAQVEGVPIGERADAFILGCRAMLSASHAEAREAREAKAAAKVADAVKAEKAAAKAAKVSADAGESDDSDGESGDVPMSADVAVATLASIAGQSWGVKDRETVAQAMRDALVALELPALV